MSWLGPRGQCRECLDRKLTNACPPGEKTGLWALAAAATAAAAAAAAARQRTLLRSLNRLKHGRDLGSCNYSFDQRNKLKYARNTSWRALKFCNLCLLPYKTQTERAQCREVNWLSSVNVVRRLAARRTVSFDFISLGIIPWINGINWKHQMEGFTVLQFMSATIKDTTWTMEGGSFFEKFW